jgi:phosphate transport system permease protein
MRRFEQYFEKILFSAALLSASITLLIFIFMLVLGLPLFRGGLFWNLLSDPWMPQQGLYGIYPMIISTMSIAFLGFLFAFPLSLGTAMFISGLAPGRIATFVNTTVRMMTAIPTVVYGFVGIFLLVPLMRNFLQGGSGMCVLTAALVLAVVIAPTMILFFISSFRSVPNSYLRSAVALGATPVQKLLHVVVPSSWNGILTGCVLALGRAMGDTMIALMLAGNAIAVPDGITAAARALTAHIALVIAADVNSMEFKSIFACGIVLYVLTALFTAVLRLTTSRRALS